MLWKYGVDRMRTGDDINEKRKPDLASRRNAWYSYASIYTHATAKNTKDGVERKLLYKLLYAFSIITFTFTLPLHLWKFPQYWSALRRAWHLRRWIPVESSLSPLVRGTLMLILMCTIRIIHEHGYTPEECLTYRPVVYSNVTQSLVAIVRAAGQLNIEFEHPDRAVNQPASS